MSERGKKQVSNGENGRLNLPCLTQCLSLWGCCSPLFLPGKSIWITGGVYLYPASAGELPRW